MNFANAVTAKRTDEAIAGLKSALGAENLYIMSHDLSSLHSLDESSDVFITDEGLIDSLLGGEGTEYQGKYFVPVMNRMFPILAATGITPDPNDDDPQLFAGLVTDYLFDLFDFLESRRRPEPLTPAAQLQWSMLPLRAACIGGYEIAGALQPAASVAGDAYDFAVTPGESVAALVMDAMGHGVAAALSSSLALATIRTTRRSGAPLLDQVCAADAAIQAQYGGDRFVTMAAMEIYSDSVSVVNAGHEPIRRVSAKGEVQTLSLDADPPLGLDGLTEYRVHSLPKLEPLEMFVLLSDGATESKDSEGKVFGEQGVNKSLSKLTGIAPLQTADRLGRAVMKFIPGEIADDLTTLIVQRNDT